PRPAMFLLFSSRALVALVLIVFHSEVILAEPAQVSINPKYPHSCVNSCLIGYFGIGSGLHCASPLANNCYCPTAAAIMTSVQTLFPDCASSSCSKGDFTDDLSAMEGMYASYCLGAGYAQPLLSSWY